MATVLKWQNEEQTILLLSLHTADTEIPTIEERVADLQAAAQMAGTVTHPVAILIDLRSAPAIPRGKWLSALRQVIETAPPNLELVVTVGSRVPGFLFDLIGIIKQISRIPIEFTFARTLKEGEALLADWQAGHSTQDS